MGRRLRCFWLRFLQNAEQLDRRGLPTNVEDYINDDTAIHGPGNATLAELIPNLLTSLGILGTFMGLSSGLATLDFADSARLIEGIPTLLSGMKFAFYTSVAGISCSLIFNMLNRISQGSGFRAVDEGRDVPARRVAASAFRAPHSRRLPDNSRPCASPFLFGRREDRFGRYRYRAGDGRLDQYAGP